MARDEIKYEHIVSRLNDQIERIAIDCLSDPKRSGGSITGHCYGKVSVSIRGAKAGLVGFWQGQRGNLQGGNIIHLIQIAQGFKDHGEAVRYAKRHYLGIEDRPFTGEEKSAWAARQKDYERKKAKRESDAARASAKRELTVRQLWSTAIGVPGTLGETYLKKRGLEALCALPSIRFHPALEYPLNKQKGRSFPALLFAVQQADRRISGVWQIFLDPATGAKAHVDSGDEESAKIGFGPCAGGAVRLGPVTEEVIVGEGVETTASAWLLAGRRISAWALLSTSGMRGFVIPEGVKRLKIYSDGDSHRFEKSAGKLLAPPGEAAANALAAKARAQGVEADVILPPVNSDWNDIWLATRSA